MNLTGQPVRSKEGKRTTKKRKPVRSVLREAAEGEPCTLRLGCCNGNWETTVLAHLRMFGWAGTAQKPPDYLAVFACSSCHDALDGRLGPKSRGMWGYDDVLRAMGETLMRQFEMGNLIIRKNSD